MGELIIHPRVLERHPHLSTKDFLSAWENAFYEAVRPDSPNFPEYLWIGTGLKGREVEMVGVRSENDWLIYHANTPLSKRTRIEIDRARKF